jgi:Abi-like protein
MTPETPPVPPDDGPWLERWLSAPRLGRYLAATGDDRARALLLYDWNARISAAVLRDLAHLEVALRNAYDVALTPATPPGQTHWTHAPEAVFPPIHRTKRAPGRPAQQTDINRKPRDIIDASVQAAGGYSAPAGKVVANLTFGFWRYLSSKAHEKSLWVPYLHAAFPPKTNRGELDARVGRLHNVRNRVAHHEPLLSTSLPAALQDLLWVAERLDPSIAQYISSSTDVPTLNASRP